MPNKMSPIGRTTKGVEETTRTGEAAKEMIDSIEMKTETTGLAAREVSTTKTKEEITMTQKI